MNLPSTGACTATCPTGYWADSSNHECMPCYINTSGPDYSCTTCVVGSAYNQCTSCSGSTYLNLPSTGACTTTCPTGYWADSSNNECMPCYISTSGPYYSCTTCVVGAAYNQCTSCSGSTYLNLPSTGACTTTCPTGYWADSSNNECMPCYISTTAPYYSCTTCVVGSAYNQCTSCSGSTFLNLPSTGACTTTCPNGYWADTANNECMPCYSNGVSPYSCETCYAGSNNNCYTCFPNTFLYNSQCIAPCPNGYYGEASTNTCTACYNSGSSPYTCTTCFGQSNDECLSCNTGYLYEGQCLSSCPAGFWAQSSPNTCQPCYSSTTSPFSCLTCSAGASTNCQSCSANTYLYPNTGGQCINPCPNGYWGDTTTWTCKSCYSSGSAPRQQCATCFGPLATSCITCNSGTYFFSQDNSCLDNMSCWLLCKWSRTSQQSMCEMLPKQSYKLS